ncbi:MAG: 6-bladed beta-propeller [bacterium]|nr:6-bladed beta-propeller [bacterium]
MKPRILQTALVLTLSLMLLFSMAQSPQAAKWKGSEVEIDGVKHMKNPAKGMEKAKSVELKELWRIGGDTDDEDEFFGFIQALTSDADGNIYLLDGQLNEVKAFSADGEFIMTFGREGEGPGEFIRPGGLFISPGNRVVVQQIVPARLVQFDMEGNPLDDLPLPKSPDGGFKVYAGGRRAGDHMLMIGVDQNIGEGEMDRTTYLTSVSIEGEEIARFHDENVHTSFANIVVDEKEQDGFANRWVSDPEGNVALAMEHQAYKVKVMTPDGKVKHIIEREYDSLKRDAETKQIFTDIYTTAVARQAPNAVIKINDYHKDIMSLYIRDNGEIWVLSSHGRYDKPDNTLGTFDIFDINGHFVRQVTLEGEGDPENDFYFFIGDRLYVATDMIGAAVASQGLGGLGMGEEADPMSIICYELNL